MTRTSLQSDENCSTGQRFIRQIVTSYKIHTLVNNVTKIGIFFQNFAAFFENLSFTSRWATPTATSWAFILPDDVVQALVNLLCHSE